MHKFNYNAPAELYPSRRFAKSARSHYRRFPRATDAIQHLMEELPSLAVAGSFLEVDENRYDGAAIRRLYESSDYPLPRRAKAA